jgi:REP element-mobilizing transposase RayT
MPRQVRIEYAGAFYHVMARGNRKGDIVFDDEDRKTFLRTLGEVCKRAGFRIHAYALMSNHYHLLLETPQANLTAGMGWFQNAYTRRINTRHRLWGHLFGGAWKCLLGDPRLHSSESGEGGAGCGEGWHGIVCLEQLAIVFEGALGAAGFFGDGDGFSGGGVSG